MFQLLMGFKKRIKLYWELSSKKTFLFLSFLLLLCFLATSLCPANQLWFRTVPGVPGTGASSPEEIIRFHVKAHSDRPVDQEVKNELARMLMNEYGPSWRNCHDSKELSFLLFENINVLKQAAQDYLSKKGVSHQVHISLGKKFFPARYYGNEVYPAGEYESFEVMIGDGAGENWWCVLFPPLCFGVLPPSRESRGKDRAHITAGEILTNGQEEKQPGDKKWRFWLAELFGKKQ